jgi:fatty-acyl-CoA synthase
MAGVLDHLELSAPDARVGTFGWNTAEHMMVYFAAPGTGRVMHTINIRLFPDQVRYTVSHAGDEVVFVDRSLLPLFATYLPELDTVRHVLVFDDGADAALPDDPRVRWYADVAAGVEPVDFADHPVAEDDAAAMCYTTGTTGDPKGVVYSHRSTFLHAYCGLTTASLAVTDSDTVLPVVPMFHANAWGLPYTALLGGANLAMPGPDLSPDGLLDLVAKERVTCACGVPTIWMGMLPKVGDYDLSSLTKVMCGGSAVPRSLSENWRAAVGFGITQGWGMTETSPVASMSTLRAELLDQDDDAKATVRTKAGMALPGVEMRITDEDGAVLPWDDEATGQVEVRGPWIAAAYYRAADPGAQFTADGWLRTGDVGAIDEHGYLRLVDRTKDLIKTGGEWVSSVDLENKIMAHPEVAEAAVIAVPHPKWMERPLACVVAKAGTAPTKESILEFLARQPNMTSMGMPDDIVFIDEIPRTSVGKFSKRALRDRFADYQLPTA